MRGTTISLADVAARTEVLAVACNRCERRGRLSVARLVNQHGGTMPMRALLRFLTQDCCRHGAIGVNDHCGACFPELPTLFGLVNSSRS